MIELTYETRSATPRVMDAVESFCRTVPLTVVVIRRSSPSSPVDTHGPSGQKVSKLFAWVQLEVRRPRSRAVTSFAHKYPQITDRVSAAGTRLQARPTTTTTASSPSKTTSVQPGGRRIGSPG